MNRGGFGGGGGINMAQLRQQAMQMQKKMEAIQEEIGKKTIEISSGGGAVKVSITGKLEILSFKIDPEVLKDGDAEMLQDMVKAAANEAIKKAQELQNTAMGGAMGGMPMPPGLF